MTSGTMARATALAANPTVVRDWLGYLFAHADGYVSVCSDKDGFIGRRFKTTPDGLDAATEYATNLDQRNPKGIYVQSTTLSTPPATGRGGADDAFALTHLWADGDYGSIGHKPGPDDLPTPPDAETVQRIVASSGLPAATGCAYSGGGVNNIWMLDTAHNIGEDREQIAQLSATWQTILGAAAYRAGYSWDVGVGNLDRLMKLIGTVNRKELPDRPTWIGESTGAIYSLDELLAIAADLGPDAHTTMLQAATEKQQRKATRLGVTTQTPPSARRVPRHDQPRGHGPLDVLGEMLAFRDVLTPAGFTYQGQHSDGREKWLRPASADGQASSTHSLLCDDHVAVNWSERSDLPVGAQAPGQKLTIGTLWAHLNYAGNTSAAARDIMRAAGGHTAGTAAARLPAAVLAEVKQRCLAPAPPALEWADLIEPVDYEPAAATDPEHEEPAQPEPPQGLLPEAFWAARPELRHIRQAGHSRNRSGDVAFYATLARLSGMVPHFVRADTGIADLVSLNLFVSLVGPSGSGKSTGAAVARRLLTPPVLMDFRDGLPIGSGEGLAEVYMGTTEEPTGEIYRGGPKKGDPVMVTTRAQVRHNAFFYIDEGATLTRLMKERSGSTLGEVLRSAAVGQALGQTNASKDNSRYIPGGSYSMGLLVGFQPETAAPLFEDTAEGTPQRFLWGTVIDPSIPDDLVPWPGELVAWQQPLNVRTDTLVTFDKEITSELRRIDLANARGENTGEAVSALDSHAPVMKIKVGSLLAILAGRLHVTVDDWHLAELVWAASCTARDNVVAYSVQQRREEQAKRTQARIGEEIQLEQAKELAGEARTDKAVDRIATRVALLVHDEGGETTRKAVRNKFAGRDKKHMVDAINLAVLRGWITDSEGGLAPGRSRPS